MTYQLGIDLGTTFTAAAVVRGPGQQPEVVTLGTRNATIPSVLYLGPDGSTLVGEAAERRAVTDPDRVVREFKRRIGDPTPIVVGGRRWTPQDLSALLVRWVVDRVAEREGGPAARTAVTHPAAWGRHKLDLLAEAFGRQGLQVTFLPEPSAAAVAYAANQRVEPESTIAVYDLGGGTFDAAVVRKTTAGAGFDLLGRPEGIERLGGIDFDQVVFDHILDGMPPGTFDDLDDSDPEVLSAVARIRRECTEAKEALSSDTETTIQVLLPGTRGTVRMHRSEFEARIGRQVEETVAALRRAVASAGLPPEALTAVLLVGGSSRIPLVSQTVSAELGRPVAVDADPKNAIAKGAAIAVSPQPPAPPRVAAAGAAGGTGGGPAAGRFGAAGLAAGGLAAGGLAAAGAGPGFGRAGAQSPPARPPQGRLPGTTGTPPGGVAQARTSPGSSPGMRPPEGGFAAPPRHGPGSTPGDTRHLPPASAPQARPTPPRRATAPPVSPPPPREQEWEYDDRPPRRSVPLGVYLGLGALVALVIVIAVLVSNGGSQDPGSTVGEDVPAATETAAPTSAKPSASRTQGGGGGATTQPPASSTTQAPPTSTSAPAPDPTTTAPEPEPTSAPAEPTTTQGAGVPRAELPAGLPTTP